MTPSTYVGRASERVARECADIEAKREVYDRFRSRLRTISPRTAVTGTGPGPGEVLVSSTDGQATRSIRKAFDETVATAYEDRSTMDLLATELGEGVATALATGAASSSLRSAVRSAIDQRRAELAAMDRALDAEAESLERAAETIGSIREWLVGVNETPLSACGFEELRTYHERLTGFRADCDALIADRQDHLGRTTSVDGQAGVRHRDLLAHLYEPFPIDHPVLVTGTRLDGVCGDCQRAVRDHLVRRV